MAVIMKVTVAWIVTPCSLVDTGMYQCFSGTFFLRLQGRGDTSGSSKAVVLNHCETAAR